MVVISAFYPINMRTSATSCPAYHINRKSIGYTISNQKEDNATKRRLRSICDIFLIKEHCIFYGKSGDKIDAVKGIATNTFEDFLIWNSVSRDGNRK